ncbi:unnamed protein product [Menidia menidia]|uniref:(Atlantic silverside) hypothetical protein n=1 Tax=Menidia menidia TaxID=238744 RepID=A0A8S4B2H9_9TELE|nr:unnamed protein product [Menidia menidia]
MRRANVNKTKETKGKRRIGHREEDTCEVLEGKVEELVGAGNRVPAGRRGFRSSSPSRLIVACSLAGSGGHKLNLPSGETPVPPFGRHIVWSGQTSVGEPPPPSVHRRLLAMEEINNLEVVPCTESNYLKPFRVHYNQHAVMTARLTLSADVDGDDRLTTAAARVFGVERRDGSSRSPVRDQDELKRALGSPLGAWGAGLKPPPADVVQMPVCTHTPYETLMND